MGYPTFAADVTYDLMPVAPLDKSGNPPTDTLGHQLYVYSNGGCWCPIENIWIPPEQTSYGPAGPEY